MLVDITPRRPINWNEQVWYVAKMIASILIAAVAAIWIFTYGADWLTAASNARVVLGALLCIAVVVGFGAIAWLWGVKVARHFGLILLIAIVGLSGSGCTKVEPGYTGIRVNLYGRQRGVSDLPIVTGRVWYNPVTEEIYQFPTFMQNVVWTSNLNEGRSVDESFTANSKEGVAFNFDVGMSLQMDGDKVPEIFLKFREPANELIYKYVRNQVRDYFSVEASKLPIMEIVGEGKQTLLANVQRDLQDKLGPDGIHVDNVSIIGRMRLDPNVEAAINGVIEQKQQALQAEQKVAQAKAEADQRIAEANGIAQSIMIKARAQADANNVLNASITPILIQYESLQKWNGALPQVTSGATPFIRIDGLGTSSSSK